MPKEAAPDRPRFYVRARRIVLVAAVNLVLIAGGAEVILRVGERISPSLRRLLYIDSVYPVDDYAGVRNLQELLETLPWRMQPYARHMDYILNSNGLRTHEYARARKPGVRRVVLIGDSFLIHGGDIPENEHVATATENLLNRRQPTELINLGVPAVGPAFYLRMLELEGMPLKPDAVLVCLFVGNDFIDEINRYGLLVKWHGFKFVRNLYRLLAYGGGRQQWPRDPEAGSRTRGGYALEYSGPHNFAPGMTPEGYWYLQLNRSVVFHDPWPPIISEHWARMREEIKTMNETCKAGGAAFVLALIPDETQVRPDLQRRITGKMRRHRHDFGKPQKEILEFCRAEGIPVVDLLPMFEKAAAQGQDLYCPLDTHWNAVGQGLAAGAFAEKIQRYLL